MAERAVCAPDRRLLLSISRTSSPRNPNKIKLAAAGAALSLLAILGGTLWLGPAGAPARPAATAIEVHGGQPLVSSSHSATSGRTGRAPGASRKQTAVLDAFAAAAARARALTPRGIAQQMLASFHWRKWQFEFLNLLWSRESGWNVHASNPYSGAYGIPQAVPGSKMASAGPDWQNNARTQIRWGMRYIKAQYGSPYWAWEHELAAGWY